MIELLLKIKGSYAMIWIETGKKHENIILARKSLGKPERQKWKEFQISKKTISSFPGCLPFWPLGWSYM